MASFTAVGDTTTLSLKNKGEIAAVALSGTYAMTIALQREIGSPGSGAWEELKRWSTANATVAYNHTANKDAENLRLIVLVDTSGTCTATLTDSLDQVIYEFKDPQGQALFQLKQSGFFIYNQDGLLLWPTGGAGKFIDIGTTTTYTLLAANSGKEHYVADLGGDGTYTLPAPAAGLEFIFCYRGVASDASNWIITTGSNTNYFIGGLLFCDHDTDVIAPIAGNGSSNSKLTVVTPAVGTRIHIKSLNGVVWALSGFVNSATIPSFADQ